MLPAFTSCQHVQAIVLALAASTVLQAHAAASISVPDNLQVPATRTLALEAHATGVQVYTCQAAATGNGKPEWVLKAPDATLYDSAGTRLATHYAGPTWEASDGSKVVGKARASATPAADAIPWLLLDVKSTEGNGVFGKVTAVQRLATEGGKAPSDGCTAAGLDKEVRIPYKAVYRFYTAK